jgi:hypothetical protein
MPVEETPIGAMIVDDHTLFAEAVRVTSRRRGYGGRQDGT